MRYLANSTLTDNMEGGAIRHRERERVREREREREKKRERGRDGEFCSLFFSLIGDYEAFRRASPFEAFQTGEKINGDSRPAMRRVPQGTPDSRGRAGDEGVSNVVGGVVDTARRRRRKNGRRRRRRNRGGRVVGRRR